jgi:DNA-binding MarR family transcriptional regulator
MAIESLDLDWNPVIYLLTSFVIGMGSMLIYVKIKGQLSKLNFQPDHVVAEAVVSEYTRRLQNYDKVIGELRAKIDGLELVLAQRSDSRHSNDVGIVAHDSSQKYHKISQSGEAHVSQSHSSEVISHSKSQNESESLQSASSVIPNIITSKDVTHNHDMNDQTLRLSTPDHILNLLSQKPRTSKEIQKEIGKTREHTSRLMRKLYESNLVARDDNSKPFKYHITESGRRELMLYTAVAQTRANIRNPQDFPS